MIERLEEDHAPEGGPSHLHLVTGEVRCFCDKDGPEPHPLDRHDTDEVQRRGDEVNRAGLG
jgi:hypothetical protein